MAETRDLALSGDPDMRLALSFLREDIQEIRQDIRELRQRVDVLSQRIDDMGQRFSRMQAMHMATTIAMAGAIIAAVRL